MPIWTVFVFLFTGTIETRASGITVVNFLPGAASIEFHDLKDNISPMTSSLEIEDGILASSDYAFVFAYNASYEPRVELVRVSSATNRFVCDVGSLPEGLSIGIKLVGESPTQFLGKISIKRPSMGYIEHVFRSHETNGWDWQIIAFSSLCVFLPLWQWGLWSVYGCRVSGVSAFFFCLCAGFVGIAAAFFFKLNLMLTLSAVTGLMVPQIVVGNRLLKSFRTDTGLQL